MMRHHLHMPSYFLGTFTEYPFIVIYGMTELEFTTSVATGFYLFKEVIAFIIYEDKCREIFYFNFPNGFHSQFRIF